MTSNRIVLDLRKFVVPEIIFGNDARLLAGKFARNYGARRALVVTDPGVVAAGWTGEVVAALDDAEISTVIFDEVSCNPRSSEVMAGADIYKREECNAIIAVGGGSPMDCAKGIGIVSANGGNILDFEGIDQVTKPLPLMLCVPTTAGTSADVSQFAIITDEHRKVKIAIVSKTIVPDVALIDPVTTSTMPPNLAAATGADALTHAIESYVSLANSPLTDVHALEAIRLISKNLSRAVQEPDEQSRGKMMLASLEAGLAFSNTSLGAVHAMAHSIGGLLDFSHGECNAIFLGPVIGFNFREAAQRYRDILAAFGQDATTKPDNEASSMLQETIRMLLEDIGIASGLAAMGVRHEHIPSLAQAAHRDACMVTNPREATIEELERLFESAL